MGQVRQQDNESLIREFQLLQKKVEQARQDVARYKGQLDMLEKQVQSKFGVTLKVLQNEIEKRKQGIEKLRNEISTAIADIKNKYPWE